MKVFEADKRYEAIQWASEISTTEKRYVAVLMNNGVYEIIEKTKAIAEGYGPWIVGKEPCNSSGKTGAKKMFNNVKKFTDTESGLDWNIRLVGSGEKYGLNNSLENDSIMPMVEFYDCRYMHTEIGQFVSRYYLPQIFELQNSGLCLDFGIDDWKVSATTIDEIKAYLSDIF